MSLIAPDYVTPRRRRHRAPVVSLKPAGAPVSQGIKLWVNSDKYGFQLAEGAEGFGMADVENTTTALSHGGAVLRHQRSVEGEMYLPIQLVAPSSAALEDMTARLAEIVNPADGVFEIVYYSPISQEARFRLASYKSGMLTPSFHDPAGGFAEYGVTADFLDPLWRGVKRPIKFEIAPQRKPLITAHQGEIDPDNPAITYEWEDEPHSSPSVKKRDDKIIARNLITNSRFANGTEGFTSTRGAKAEIIPRGDLFPELGAAAGDKVFSFGADDSVGTSAYVSYYSRGIPLENGKYYAASLWFHEPEGLNIPGRYYMQFRNGGTNWGSSATKIVNRQPSGAAQAVMSGRIEDATDATDFWFVWWPSDLRSVPDETAKIIAPMISGPYDTEAEALAQVETYFDGDTEPYLGRYEGYQFPFFPMFVHSSTVQGEQSIRVEGDAPAWPTYTVTGPGEDLRIINQHGDQLHIPGEIDGEITITTEPGKQTIRDSNGDSLMSRLEFGTDVFFPLPPGDQTITATMVNASRESMVRIVYEEQFRLPAGNVRRR